MARKILLADDSVTAQNMGRKILADAGYEVITVNNGSAALKKIAELYPGEVERNERLVNLCQLAQWWPEGARARIEAGVQRAAADIASPSAPGDAMRDRRAFPRSRRIYFASQLHAPS